MSEILIVSNYFPPERGAAANRIGRLAKGLSERGFKVRVVCPLPNYPEGKIFTGYKGRFSVSEKVGDITVTRLYISPSKSANPVKRIFSIASFAICLKMYLLFAKLPKTVIVQSPPLLLSFISVAMLKLRRRKIILNISDLWPLAAIELGALKEKSIGHRIALFFERFIYRNADTIIGQSREILQHVGRIAHEKPAHLYRNFPETFSPSTPGSGKIKIFYAGLLGVAQGVLEACQNLEAIPNVEFHIFGDGAEKESIVQYIANTPSKHLFFHGMFPQKELARHIASFDIAFVPLRTRIYGSVPSKIFEYAAQGFPILYCGGGEGGEIVDELQLGWVCEPGDYARLNAIISEVASEPRQEIESRKIKVFEAAQSHFDIGGQMEDLLKKRAFQ